MTKKQLLIILLIITKMGFSQVNNATLDETISWFKSKLNFYYYDNLDNKTKIDIEFDKKTKFLNITQTTYKSKESALEQIKITYIPMKDINPNNIEVKEDKYDQGSYWLKIHTNNNQNLIKWETRQASKPTDLDSFKYSENESQFYIPKREIDKNENLQNRIKTSLIHLINLCGGKGEKF